MICSNNGCFPISGWMSFDPWDAPAQPAPRREDLQPALNDSFESASPEFNQVFSQMAVLRSFAEQQGQGVHHIAPKELKYYMAPGKSVSSYKPEGAIKFAQSLRGLRSDQVHLKSGFFWDPAGFHAKGENLNDRNCADFVSGVLQKAGGLTRHRSSVPQLEMQLEHDGWNRREQGAAPKPGDVWISNKRGHVELVDHVDKQGKVWTIGSNNRRDPVEGPGQWISSHPKAAGSGFFLSPPQK